MDKIISYLEELIPNPRCELNYNKDYELVIAVMLSSQTTDKRVNEVTKILFKKYPTLESLAKANVNDLKDIIRPLGNFNKKALNVKLISEKLLTDGGKVRNDREFLESLPGVGRKTTNVVLGILYNENVIAVDTHVARVSKRLQIALESDNVLEIEKKLYKRFSGEELVKLHHRLVLFGRYYCKAKNPLCKDCKLKDICKRSFD